MAWKKVDEVRASFSEIKDTEEREATEREFNESVWGFTRAQYQIAQNLVDVIVACGECGALSLGETAFCHACGEANA